MILLSSLSSDDAKWWLGTSELLLIVSAIVLSLGLGGEWSDSDAWKKCFWYKLAKAAVILGVVGELLGDAGIFEATARLQTLEERSIADANTIASAAIDRAASAGKEAAEANEHARSLEKEIEELRAKNLAIEKEVAPRRIDPAQCKDIASAVKSFPWLTVRVASYSMDPDGGILAWQIAGCLMSAHSVYVDVELSSILPAGAFGFGVFVSGKNELLVSAIKQSLETPNIQVVDGTGIFPSNQLAYRPGAPSNPDAIVVVGIKPPIDMK